MHPTLITACFAGVVFVAGCGGGGGNSNVRPDSTDGPMVESSPPPANPSPYLHPQAASQSPTIQHLSLGLLVNPPSSAVTTVARHDTPASHVGWVPVDTSLVADGTTKSELISYLSADIAASGGTLDRFLTPPVIHIATGATDQDTTAILRAVQMINASLPDTWQLSIAPNPKRTSGNYLAGPGEILMVFADRDEWASGCDHGLACADVHISTVSSGAIRRATIFADPDSRADPMYTAWSTHEILHALGRGHADPQQFPQSVMVPLENLGLVDRLLSTLDRDALVAVYGLLEAGDTNADLHEKLGAWEHESFHVMGGMLFGDLSGSSSSSVWFGVADRNGKQIPWVLGKHSARPLAENPSLQGSARWEGRLLGMTPAARIVAGDASLDIDLDELSGELAFTGLEQWAPRADPGAIGTGTQWGDGDLRYGVEVRGSTFIQSGSGDAGIVTGAFIGPTHDGMGGTLQRTDLDAAFGGVHQ